MTPADGTSVRRGRLTEEDYAQIARCRHEHTRFGLAYQIVFYRLTGRLPQQRPFEVAPEVARDVAEQLRTDEERAVGLVGQYAAGKRTVFQHQIELRDHLGVTTYGADERQTLHAHLREAAAHLDRTAGLVAHAEAYLRDARILLPAASTLRRLAGEVLADVAAETERRVEAALSDGIRLALDGLLEAGGSETHSPLQMLKDPPGATSPRALVAETDKLSTIRETGALGVDLSWLRPSRRKALAHRVRASTAHRLRELKAPRRYAALVCFLHEAHADTVDHVVDLHAKLVTQTYRRAERRTEAEWGARYGAVFASWHRHWPSLVAFYDFPVGLRRVLYTTNAVEAVHRSFRRALKHRGALPNEMAAMKLCYAVSARLAEAWTRVLPNWPLLLNELLVRDPERFEPFLARTQTF